jgi:hypothetical protein
MRHQAIRQKFGDESVNVGSDLGDGDIIVFRAKDRDHFLDSVRRWREQVPDLCPNDSDAEVNLGLGGEEDTTFRKSLEDGSRNSSGKQCSV